MLRILGVKCTKNTLDWVILEGVDRASATKVDSGYAKAPAGTRGEELVWVRKEILEITGKQDLSMVAIRAAEAGGQGNSLPRAEVEGVVQEAIASSGLECRRILAVSLRAAFSAKNATELQDALLQVPLVAETIKAHLEPVTAALAILEK
ncbi:hypothetical protein [Actinoplanes sp. HUAS TT8]|uniref:hypothetical protein n=1 Tax=Actinoplanes sp. HUAS TT8 TaxID=3447453 RepID=UPI003F525600